MGVLTTALLSVVAAAGQAPDLQGVYVNNDATPLNRPKELEGKPYLTDAEVAELQKRADRLFKHGDNEAAGGDNVFLAALANVVGNGPGSSTLILRDVTKSLNF